ncbi:MAG: hypothetical protein DI535_14145 [Citrobacter freundii]|nr:MAG: hypothetical protein DI535_14145 [Citrobacter freundii]
MSSARESLIEILKNESERIRNSYPSEDVIFPIIEIIRAIDYYSFLLRHDLNIEKQQLLLDRYLYGWAHAFSIFYADLSLTDNIPLFKFSKKDKEWLDSIIQHSGSIQICQQHLDFEKADLIKLTSFDNQKFQFEFLVETPGSEYFEIQSLAYYHSITEEALEFRITPLKLKLPEMRKKLNPLVKVFHEDFISYQASDEADLFYSELGYVQMMTSQIIDEFDQTDIFGGIQYKDYMDLVEDNFGSALMHRDCCMALAEKTSHQIFLRNILSYCFSKEAFLSVLEKMRKLNKEKVSQIISCLTISKENYQYHLNYPGANPAPFFQVGNDTLIRSDYGSLSNPVFFLNRELKRKYPIDYFNAVNRRELRFKKQLYDLFPSDRIIKILDNVEIKVAGRSTDIDAVLFDKDRLVLGLFQLKWQDSFSNSSKERFSRITNLVPKSVEWIDKIQDWIKSNDSQSLLRTLKIEGLNKINDIHLFVLARNHVHFTNTELDKRASWGSWFQLLEASAKVKDPFNTNPIGELAAKLNFFSPNMRREIEEPLIHQDIEFSFSKYQVSIKGKKCESDVQSDSLKEI